MTNFIYANFYNFYKIRFYKRYKYTCCALGDGLCKISRSIQMYISNITEQRKMIHNASRCPKLYYSLFI